MGDTPFFVVDNLTKDLFTVDADAERSPIVTLCSPSAHVIITLWPQYAVDPRVQPSR